MWARTHDGLRRDQVAAGPHGVVEDADGLADRPDEVRRLLHGDVEVGAEELDGRLVAGDPLDRLADRLGCATGVRRDEQRVVGLHAQRLTHVGVDDRVDPRDLGGVRADGHRRRVAAAAQAEGALLARHPLLQVGHQRELTRRHPVPLLLELGALGRRVVAVGGGVDGREVDGAVLDAHLGHRQPLDAADPVETADPVDHVVGERVLAEDQDVGVAQRSSAWPDAVGRVRRRRGLARLGGGGSRRRTRLGRTGVGVVVATGGQPGREQDEDGRHRCPPRSPAHRSRVGGPPHRFVRIGPPGGPARPRTNRWRPPSARRGW